MTDKNAQMFMVEYHIIPGKMGVNAMGQPDFIPDFMDDTNSMNWAKVISENKNKAIKELIRSLWRLMEGDNSY